MDEQHLQRPLVRTARIAGAWYLLLAVSGILGFIVLHPQVYVSGDPGQTLSNLSGSGMLPSLRLICELLIVLSQALAAFSFYRLFRSLGGWQAWAVGIWGTVNAIVILFSAISMASAIAIANSESLSYADKLLPIELLMNFISHSWAIGGIFFGLWLIPMGHVIITSKRMPLWLGRTLILGGVGYILSTFIYYAGIKHPFLNVLTIPATLGEFWMIGYLLIYGVRPRRG